MDMNPIQGGRDCITIRAGPNIPDYFFEYRRIGMLCGVKFVRFPSKKYYAIFIYAIARLHPRGWDLRTRLSTLVEERAISP